LARNSPGKFQQIWPNGLGQKLIKKLVDAWTDAWTKARDPPDGKWAIPNKKVL